jgi:16S rRNA (cytosine1402-N4)-methyltransferase
VDAKEVHRPVLLEEVLERLAPSPGEVHVDATLGGGGHAAAILSRLGPDGMLIGIDRDPRALEIARPRLEATGHPFRLVEGPYSRIREFLRLCGLPQERAMDGLLLDLGVSSLQLDRPERGFSFLRDGPLDMRMSGGGESAREFLERASAEEIEEIIREYGEEPAARRIAAAIERARRKEGIRTTGDLARVVESVLPRRGKRTHPATRTFQGIRIAINEELEHLRLVLRGLDRLVKPGGRVVVLSYHSLEDRMVKRELGEGAREGVYRWILPSPLLPGAREIEENPRARSAKLRAVVRAGPLPTGKARPQRAREHP